MRNRGQVSVFLCLVMMSILLLGLTAIERVRVSMGSARAAESADGASQEIMAAYNKELFDEYHLLAVDKEFAGQGEGKMEEMAEDYLEYIFDGSGDDDMRVESVQLAQCRGILENDCANMKKQITEYMKIYIETEGVNDILEMMTVEKDAGRNAKTAIENGQNDEHDGDEDWSGTDPRKRLKKAMSGGILKVVTPAADVPSEESFDERNPLVQMSELPSKNHDDNQDEQWEDIEFDDIDAFKKQLDVTNPTDETGIKDDFYGICYALETFNTYTSQRADRTVECEVEYIIAGEDNDQDNLKGVVNRIILHRLPMNMAYLLSDSGKMGAVKSIAFALSILPGVTYPVTKYLLAGCWAYAETLVDIRCMLGGNNIKFMKSDKTWRTDIDSLGDILSINSENYEGNDAIGYKGYLAILMAENRKNMYYRMADLIQINLSKQDESFDMRNMIYGISIDVDIVQDKKYAPFIESYPGVGKIDDGYYCHGFRISTDY